MMMVANRIHEHGESTGCPVHQMTFGEIARYLQGGYEPPVQRAIASHVKYCNVCAAELERVIALRASGGHIFSEHLADFTPESSGVEHIEDAVLAAFVDNRVDEHEQERIVAHLASCHACYQHYAAAVNDSLVPVPSRLHVPASVIATVLDPVPTMSLGQALGNWLGHLNGLCERFLGGPWKTPALAIALGVIVMIILLPGLPKTPEISLQALHQNAGDGDHIISGNLHSYDLDDDVLVLKREIGAKVSFTWPLVNDHPVKTYRIGVYNDKNVLVSKKDLTENKWTVARDVFKTESFFTLNVIALYEGGGVRPIIRAQKIRAE